MPQNNPLSEKGQKGGFPWQSSLKADVILFNNFKAKEIIPDLTSASEIYESLYKDDLLRMVPELSKVLKIFAVIPATTCTAERSFSSLRQMKS